MAATFTRGAVITHICLQRFSYHLLVKTWRTVPRFFSVKGFRGTGRQKTKTMKKLFLFVSLALLSVAVQAQKDVTHFLGIPVDGDKAEMIRKIKAKGFQSSPSPADSEIEVLTGQFNGVSVNVLVQTNNDKVYRIIVSDVNLRDERDIQIRFNALCRQFANNPNYLTLEDYTIPDDEKIGYEMLVHHKRYESLSYQHPVIDSAEVMTMVQSAVLDKYTEEQRANSAEKIQADIIQHCVDYVREKTTKKPVWFMISEVYGQYRIVMFYENRYNEANGEEL